MKIRNVLYLILAIIALWVVGCDFDDESSTESPAPVPLEQTDDDDDSTGNDAPEDYGQGPQVTITSPAPYSIVAGAQSLEVTGSVVGDVSRVRVNDQDVPLKNGAFSTSVDFPVSENFLSIVVTANDGKTYSDAERVVVIRGSGLPLSEPIPDAFVLGLPQGGLDLLAGIMGDLMSLIELGPFIASLPPLYDDPDVSFTLEWVEAAGVEFELIPSAEGLMLRGIIRNFTLMTAIWVKATGLPVYQELLVDQIRFYTTFNFAESNPGINVSLNHFDFVYQGVSLYPIYHFPIPGFDAIGENLVSTVLGVMEPIFSLLLPPVLEAALNAIALDMPIAQFDTKLALQSINVDNDSLDVSFTADLQYADSSGQWELRTLYTNGPVPDFSSTAPGSDREYALGLALSDDFLSRTLYAFADSGLLEFSIPTTVSTIAAAFPALGKVAPETPATLALSAAAPPYALMKNEGIALRFPDLRIDVIIVPEGKESWKALTLSADLEIALNLTVDDQGMVVIGLGDLGGRIYILDNPIHEDGVFADAVGQLIEPALIDLLVALLSGFQLPAFDLLGLAIEPAWAGQTGAKADFWSIYLAITPLI